MGLTLGDLKQRALADHGGSEVAAFEWALGLEPNSGRTLGDLRHELFGSSGEHPWLVDLLDAENPSTPVNELRKRALEEGKYFGPHLGEVPALAAHYDAEQVEAVTLLADDFERADGPLGSVPGPGDPVAWEILSGTFAIQGGKAVRTSSSGDNWAVVESGVADCVVSCDITFAGDDDRLIVRGGVNYLAADIAGGTVRLFKPGTVLASTPTSLVAGDTANLAVAMKGDRMAVFVDGVYVLGHTLSAADYTAFGTQTKHGIGGSAGPTGGIFDNFVVRTLDPTTDLAVAVDTFDRSTAAEIVDVGPFDTALRQPGTAGNTATTPDNASLDITGDIDVRWFGVCDDWGTNVDGFHTLISKRVGSYCNYSLRVTSASGDVQLIHTVGTVFETGVLPGASLTDGELIGIRVTRQLGGQFVGYLADNPENPDATSWTQFASVSSSSNAPDTNEGAVTLGSSINDVRRFKGEVHRAQVFDGIDGTLVADFDPTVQAAGTTSFDDAQGNTWTINQADGALGSTETGEAAATAWTVGTGTWHLRNGQLVATGNFSTQTVTVDAGIADVDVSARMPNVNGFNNGIIFRHVDTQNFLLATMNGTDLRIYKRDTGTFTSIAYVTGVLGDTRMRIVAVGDRIWVYCDGELKLSHTLTGAEQTKYGAATKVGCYGNFASTTFDNFRVARPPLVPVWPDLSGKHRHAVQTATAKQPVLLDDGQNGRPVVRFDGVDDYMQRVYAAPLAQPNTVLTSAQLAAGGQMNIVDGTGTGRHALHASGANTWAAYVSTTIAGGTRDTDWHTHAAIYDGLTSERRLDGTSIATGDVGTGSMAGITLGSNQAGTATFADGDIAEVLVSDGDLSVDGRLDATENYLIRKWT